MKRKAYRTPTTKAVQLQHTGMLMTSGEVQASKAAQMNVQYTEETWTEE